MRWRKVEVEVEVLSDTDQTETIFHWHTDGN